MYYVYRIGYGLEGPGFEYRQGQEIFFYRSLNHLHHFWDQSSLQFNGYLGSIPGVQQPGSETAHSSSVEVKYKWSCTTVHPIRLHGVGRDKFISTSLWISLTYILTYSIQQSPSWETNRFSATQETPRILWNTKVHYRIHKCPPLVPILSHIDPVHTPIPTSWRSILILSFPSIPESSMCSLFLRFPHLNTVYTSTLHHT